MGFNVWDLHPAESRGKFADSAKNKIKGKNYEF